MSGYTKSKLKVYKGFDRLYLYATQLPGSPRIADIPDTGAITKEERIANAAYMNKCWNCHDELVAACKMVVKNFDDFSDYDREAFPGLAREYDLCKAALDNAKKT